MDPGRPSRRPAIPPKPPTARRSAIRWSPKPGTGRSPEDLPFRRRSTSRYQDTESRRALSARASWICSFTASAVSGSGPASSIMAASRRFGSRTWPGVEERRRGRSWDGWGLPEGSCQRLQGDTHAGDCLPCLRRGGRLGRLRRRLRPPLRHAGIQVNRWSGRQDLNLRRLGPKPSALPG